MLIFRAYVYGDTYNCAQILRVANPPSANQQPLQPRSMLAKRMTSTKIKENSSQISVLTYPNPTAESVFYELKSEQSFNYTVSDLTGRVLETGTLTNYNNQVNLTSFKSGIYLVTIKNNSYTQTDRIILQ